MMDNRSVELEYRYDVIISGPFGMFSFERMNFGELTLPDYMGPAPYGMRFAGYLVNGELCSPGDICEFDDPLIVKVVFEDVPEEPANDDNSWVAWVVVIVALAVLALLCAGLCVYRRL